MDITIECLDKDERKHLLSDYPVFIGRVKQTQKEVLFVDVHNVLVLFSTDERFGLETVVPQFDTLEEILENLSCDLVTAWETSDVIESIDIKLKPSQSEVW